MNNLRVWTAGAVVAALVIAAGGWFLLIAPKRSEAATLKQQAATIQSANTQLRQDIATLEQMKRDLPKVKADIATIRTQIPTNPAMPKLIRDVQNAAIASGVTLINLDPSDMAAVPVAANTVTGTSTASGTSPAAASVQPETLYFSDLSFVVETTSYADLVLFLSKVEHLKRAYQATDLDVTAMLQSTAPAAAGTSAPSLTIDNVACPAWGPTVPCLKAKMQIRVYITTPVPSQTAASVAGTPAQ